VAGVTSRCAFNFWGRSLISAASTARSIQSMRGLGLVRRRTAFSWRKTRISTSLAALLRVSRVSHSVVRQNARLTRPRGRASGATQAWILHDGRLRRCAYPTTVGRGVLTPRTPSACSACPPSRASTRTARGRSCPGDHR
jgi:hypothetical protein